MYETLKREILLAWNLLFSLFSEILILVISAHKELGSLIVITLFMSYAVICDLCSLLFQSAHQHSNIVPILYQFTLELKFCFYVMPLEKPRELSGLHSIWGIKRYWISFCCLRNHSKPLWLKTTAIYLARHSVVWRFGLISAVWWSWSLLGSLLHLQSAGSWWSHPYIRWLADCWLAVGTGISGLCEFYHPAG